MLRRAALLIVLAGCSTEDDWRVRPPGGGTGTTGETIDAAPRSDAALDGGGGLTGLVCVVEDLRRPEVCPLVAAGSGVLVRKVGDTAGATSGPDLRFTLAVSAPQVVLEIGAGSAALQRAIVAARNDGDIIHAPVPTAAAWAATVDALDVAVAPGSGAIALYVDTAAGGPAAGVIVAPPPGVIAGPFYDGGSATTWTTAGGTGAFGVALLVDLDPGTYDLDGNQGARQLAISDVLVYAGAVTFVRGTLPP